MSRGPGIIQRSVLALLSEHPATIPEIARAIFQTEGLAPAQYETVRRAVDVLYRRGAIFTIGCRRRAFRGSDGREKGSWIWTTDERASLESKRDDALNALATLEPIGRRFESSIIEWQQLLADVKADLRQIGEATTLKA